MSRAIAVFHGRFGRATIYQLNRPYNVHAHREAHLLFHLGGANAAVNVAEGSYPVASGTFVAVSPWEPHNFVPADADDGALFFVLYVNPEWFAPTGQGDAARIRFGRQSGYRTALIDRLIRRTSAMVYASHSLNTLDLELRALIEACHDQTWRRGGEASERRALENVTDFRVRKSIRLMQKTLAADIQLDEVARESGLSRPHFYKLFRTQTGVTPNLYLNTLLMERAIDTLVTTETAVADIGFELGFSSQSGFTRFFAANVGMAPTDYRRAAQLL